MSATRRQFIRNASLGAAALALPIPLFGQSAKPGAAGFSPSQWLRIGKDGRTVLVVAHSEMGQGVRTSLAMILAEELEADWKAVVIEQASPGPLFTDTGTGGSDSVTSSWKPLREAGAAAREMLIEAAAKRWSVPPSACRAEMGTVIHAASNRKAAYGELVGAAAALPVPKAPRLKDAKDFRLIGTRVSRIDGPGIVSGRAVYGIDTRVPGMLYAAVAVCPVRGGKLARYEVTKAKAVAGVKDVVTIEGGVAVLAEDTFAALSGRDALGVVWDEGENGKLTTEELWKRIDRAAASPGLSSRKAGDAGAALAAFADEAVGDLSDSVPGARHARAGQHDRQGRGRRLRDLVAHAVSRARAEGRGETARDRAREGDRARDAARRRLRPAPRLRLRDPGRGDRAGREAARPARLVARR